MAVALKLYDEWLPYRLYKDHANGMTIPELAAACHRSPEWVSERVEAMRLCLERQIRVHVSENRQLIAIRKDFGREHRRTRHD